MIDGREWIDDRLLMWGIVKNYVESLARRIRGCSSNSKKNSKKIEDSIKK